MKISKTLEIKTEITEIKPGEYYFEDINVIPYRFVLNEPDEDSWEYKLEKLYPFSNHFGITIKEGTAWDENDLPYAFKEFILGESGKKISKEEYYKEKSEILNRL